MVAIILLAGFFLGILSLSLQNRTQRGYYRGSQEDQRFFENDCFYVYAAHKVNQDFFGDNSNGE